MSGLTQLGAAAGALLAILALVALVWRSVRRAWRPVDDFLADWNGEQGRPGVPARPGVMDRLSQFERRMAKVEGQVMPNGGTSMHDAVQRIAAVTGADPD